jgi:hypothetical protein
MLADTYEVKDWAVDQEYASPSTNHIYLHRWIWGAISKMMSPVLGESTRAMQRLQRYHKHQWYVSNVSIIFDAPCLFLHHLLSVSLHFVAFLCISEPNLLTRCHSASSLFSAVFVFQKSYTGNILRIGRNKSRTSRYLTKLPEDRRGDGTEPEGGLTTRGRGPGPGHSALWWAPPGPLLTLPLRL